MKMQVSLFSIARKIFGRWIFLMFYDTVGTDALYELLPLHLY